MIETKLLNRRGIGVDINAKAIRISEKNINFKHENSGVTRLYNADARNLNFIPNSYVDLICTHPPYANIIKYSDGIDGDLSFLEVDNFCKAMENVSLESYRVLKKNKFCAILMGDIRRQGNIIPLGFRVMNIFESVGFKIKEIVIKEQHNCKNTDKWKQESRKYNFLLIVHEYLFIFKK